MNTLHTDFWMDRSTNVDVLTGERFAPSKDYAKLAATKRAIANFVSIVTGKSIPVKYNSGNDSYTDGEVVVISSKVDDNNFDHVVGLALHEGSHCALTNFDTVQVMQDALRKEYADAGKDWYEDNGYEAFRDLKEILNYVEDRRIGSRTLAFNSAYIFVSGTAPTMSTAANAIDLLVYNAKTTTAITTVVVKALATAT